MIGNALSQVISLFSILKITHVLAPNDYGVFSFLSMQGLLLLSISNLGIKNIVVRSIARDPLRSKDLVINGIILKSLALLIISGLYVVYNYYFGRLTVEQLILVFSFSLINVFFDSFQDTFFAREKMFIPSLINLLYSLGWLLVVFQLPADYFTVTNLFYSFLILNVLKASSYFLFLKQQKILIGEITNFRVASVKLLQESWPYFVLIIIMLPFTMFSNNFLDINSTIKEVGYFNLSQKLIGPISMVIDLGLIAIFPNISALWNKDQNKFYRYISVGFKYYMVLSLLLCFLFTLFSGEIITLLFSDKYLPAIKVSQLQIWYLFLASIDSLIGTILGAINKEKLILKFAIIKAIFCTPLLFFGSKYGAIGLSYGYIFSVAVFEIYLWKMFIKTMNIKIKNSDFLWLLSLVLFLISYFFIRDISLLYKVLLAIVVIWGGSFYFFNIYKSRIADE